MATIADGPQIRFSIAVKGKRVLSEATFSMRLEDGKEPGRNVRVIKAVPTLVDTIVTPLYGINDSIQDHYNELRLYCEGGYDLVFRAYDEGFAYRIVTSFPDSIHILEEKNRFSFAGNYQAYFHPQLSESEYRLQHLSDQQEPNYSSLPLLIKKDSLNILIHESDVLNYPCMALTSDPETPNTLESSFHPYPKKAEPGGYKKFNLEVKDTEPFIASAIGKRNFPWRVIAFEEADKDILNNELIYLLASENRLSDTKWIRPGKVAWDWWSALNLKGVSFKPGFNTETYKYFIDFAAAHGIEYINLDEGWSDQFDLLKTADQLDMAELVRYSSAKKVRIILWCVWHVLDRQMIPALEQFRRWNIAGVKVDFMDRDDQVVVDFQERLLQETAKRHILVNYHGAYHPNGMNRTYPNLINIEGVKGLEWNKFDSAGTSPDHDVMLPFIRMFAGSMDYTPGAMHNSRKTDWHANFNRPASQGTLCHQLAMYVVYYGALQMLADAPTSYEKQPEVLNFIASVPTVWHKTVPLAGELGKYVAVARKAKDTWFIGAMTNWDQKTLTVRMDFLDAGRTYTLTAFEDGSDSDSVAGDFKTFVKTIRKGDVVTIPMKQGGGWVATVR